MANYDKPSIIDEWRDGDKKYRIIEKGVGRSFTRVIESSARVDAMEQPIWQEEAVQRPNEHGRDRDCSEPSGLLKALLVRVLELLSETGETACDE